MPLRALVDAHVATLLNLKTQMKENTISILENTSERKVQVLLSKLS